jgi:hypothetical protein
LPRVYFPLQGIEKRLSESFPKQTTQDIEESFSSSHLKKKKNEETFQEIKLKKILY